MLIVAFLHSHVKFMLELFLNVVQRPHILKNTHVQHLSSRNCSLGRAKPDPPLHSLDFEDLGWALRIGPDSFPLKPLIFFSFLFIAQDVLLLFLLL